MDALDKFKRSFMVALSGSCWQVKLGDLGSDRSEKSQIVTSLGSNKMAYHSVILDRVDYIEP